MHALSNGSTKGVLALQEGNRQVMDTLVVQKIEAHSVDHDAGAHVRGVHIHGKYQHPDGRESFVQVHLERSGTTGVSHPAGTDADAIWEAAVGTAQAHLEQNSALVKHVHHGDPHSTPVMVLNNQAHKIIRAHRKARAEARENPPQPERPAAAQTEN